MNDPQRTTEYDFCPEPVEENFYQTGDTHIPQSHRGLIAFLLVVIIILGSIVGFLGLMNVRLFRQLDMLYEQGTTPMRFDSDGKEDSVAEPPVVSHNSAGTPVLGLSGYILSSFEQMVYRLPQGFYVVSVDGDAQVKGVQPGDVLVKLGGISVTDMESLKSQVQACRAGETISLDIVRSGKEYTFSVVIGEIK